MADWIWEYWTELTRNAFREDELDHTMRNREEGGSGKKPRMQRDARRNRFREVSRNSGRTRKQRTMKHIAEKQKQLYMEVFS